MRNEFQGKHRRDRDMGTLGVGIIGCGWVAGEYVKAFHEDPRAEIRALVSRHPANAQRYRDRKSVV